MPDLKTLRDIEYIDDPRDGEQKTVDVDELKELATKWIENCSNECAVSICGNGEFCIACERLMHVLNIELEK